MKPQASTLGNTYKPKQPLPMWARAIVVLLIMAVAFLIITRLPAIVSSISSLGPEEQAPASAPLVGQATPRQSQDTPAMTKAEQTAALNLAKASYKEINGDLSSSGEWNRVQKVEHALVIVAERRASWDKLQKKPDRTFEEIAKQPLDSLAREQALLAEDVGRYNEQAEKLGSSVLEDEGLPKAPIPIDKATGLPIGLPPTG